MDILPKIIKQDGVVRIGEHPATQPIAGYVWAGFDADPSAEVECWDAWNSRYRDCDRQPAANNDIKCQFRLITASSSVLKVGVSIDARRAYVPDGMDAMVTPPGGRPVDWANRPPEDVWDWGSAVVQTLLASACTAKRIQLFVVTSTAVAVCIGRNLRLAAQVLPPVDVMVRDGDVWRVAFSTRSSLVMAESAPDPDPIPVPDPAPGPVHPLPIAAPVEETPPAPDGVYIVIYGPASRWEAGMPMPEGIDVMVDVEMTPLQAAPIAAEWIKANRPELADLPIWPLNPFWYCRKGIAPIHLQPGEPCTAVVIHGKASVRYYPADAQASSLASS